MATLFKFMAPLSRRGFLGVASAALLHSEPRKKVMVAAHPWVYAATQPKNDISGVLDRIFADMSYAGLDAIELMHTALVPNDAVARIGELSQRHKLPVIGMSFSGTMWDRGQHGQILDLSQLTVERLASLGGRTMGVSVGGKKDRKTPAELDIQAELLRKLISICNAKGVVLNLHNHTYEVRDNEYDLNGTLARISDVKLGPDLNWLVRAGIDPVDFIRHHARSIVFAHLRDQRADGKWPEAMGEGVMDYAAIGRTLHEIGFSGDLAIELAHEPDFQLTRPLRESLKTSRDYVRRVMGY